MLKKHVQQHRQCDHGHNKLTPVYQQKNLQPIRVADKPQKELMAIFAHKENSNILCAEWLDENDVDLSGLSFNKMMEMMNMILCLLLQ